MAIEYTKRSNSQPAPSGAGDGVNLHKVTLTKSAPTVSLSKAGGSGGLLRVNLNWNTRHPQRSGGLFKRGPRGGAIDLDLGCLYELNTGEVGVVQALGDTFQAWAGGSSPVIRLDGDDRSGANSAGENLFVDLAQLPSIRRILVFAFIYEGVPNWAAADGVVTLFPQSGPQIEVRLDESTDRAHICAIAQLTNAGGELQVSREVRYIDGAQRALDHAYGFGLQWTPARK